jgi:hypothetical protein
MKTSTSTHEQEHDHHQAIPSDVALRVKALESLLVEKGLVDPVALDELIDAYENKIGPRSRCLELRMPESTTSERDWRKPTEPRKRTCDRFAT